MNTERKPVDVLAVMDAHAASCESAAIRNSSEDNIAAHNAACEARAAVAELIEAHGKLAAFLASGTPNAKRLAQALSDAVGKETAAALALAGGA